MLNWNGTGMGVMGRLLPRLRIKGERDRLTLGTLLALSLLEISHRSPAFVKLLSEAEDSVRKLM